MSIQRSLFAVVGVSFIILGMFIHKYIHCYLQKYAAILMFFFDYLNEVLSRLSGVEGIKCYTCSDCSNFTSNANGTIPTQFLMECKANETACVVSF